MPVTYVIHRSKVNKDTVRYIARVRSLGTADLDDVIQVMTKQVGATVARSQVLSTFEDFCNAVAYLLAQGYNVTTPLANFRVSVQGAFEGLDDVYDPARHRVTVQASAGTYLRRTVPGMIELTKKPDLPLQPVPEAYTDAGSGTRNDRVTPRNAGKLTGFYLRFEPADPDQGVFFRCGEGGRVRVTYYSEIRPGGVHFLTPDLLPGRYRLEVRTRSEESGELLSRELDADLTVV